MNYLEKVDEIIYVLTEADEELFTKQIKNAILMGGTGGEILAIICSLFKTYEVQQLGAFDLIKKQAVELYEYAKKMGIHPVANFGLLEELSS